MANKSLRLEENKLRDQISRLPLEKKRHYYNLEEDNLKDPDTYAALNWLFIAGLHHFYLGRWKRGSINLILMMLGTLLLLTGHLIILGAVLVFFTFVIELPQLFNSKNIIHEYNNKQMKALLGQVDG
jgi:TM2 domain-containing membrane protein YozV